MCVSFAFSVIDLRNFIAFRSEKFQRAQWLMYASLMLNVVGGVPVSVRSERFALVGSLTSVLYSIRF
jgi:hypothetical protein